LKPGFGHNKSPEPEKKAPWGFFLDKDPFETGLNPRRHLTARIKNDQDFSWQNKLEKGF